jgi:hypothetical protein
MTKREAKAWALHYLATRAEELADPLMGDELISEEDNERIGAAFMEVAGELRRRAERLN